MRWLCQTCNCGCLSVSEDTASILTGEQIFQSGMKTGYFQLTVRGHRGYIRFGKRAVRKASFKTVNLFFVPLKSGFPYSSWSVGQTPRLIFLQYSPAYSVFLLDIPKLGFSNCWVLISRLRTTVRPLTFWLNSTLEHFNRPTLTISIKASPTTLRDFHRWTGSCSI